MRSSAYSDVDSAASMTSTFRHSKFAPTSTAPDKKLLTDSSHRPKTHGSFGILVVGLGGANGTTMLAGILANRLGIDWRGAKGEPMTPNYYGCITQLDQRGVHGGVGYRDMVSGLADASMAAIGGWEIRPTPPGDALLEAQILDYDLVRQVQQEMNKFKLFRGLFDPRFIGTSQHETATHVLTEMEAQNDSEALKCLRADIRYFKWRNGVVGHTTVIWSASVEPNSELVSQLRTANELLQSIELTEDERGGPLPPSLLYATAALLEGCSFVNGGSQNTLDCPALWELAKQQLGVYLLGTDFKAGQTKFKTAAVEYIRTMGLTPKVIASSNHLGNNDMRNLASAKAASSAKLRVKHDIFAPWDEPQLDHKVSIMFTPFINDDKRDFVEYTSLGFLGQTHTMVTYTRASDSVLCVPLMIDAAVWCDFFSARSWPYEKVSKALAYLFKVPEGAAKGVDPGFFKQMQELKEQVLAAHESKAGHKTIGGISSATTEKRRVRIRAEEEEAVAEWAIPHNARIICAGLACVDMQLNDATGGDGGEGIETFQGEKSIGGGSVSMACKTLARLCHGAHLGEGYMQVTPPVVSSVTPLCMIGNDDSGTKLLSLLEECGSASRNVDTRVVRQSRVQHPSSRTALSVLPIYQDGRRGCFFDAASNNDLTTDFFLEMISELSSGLSARGIDTSGMSTPEYGALLFGYPHLLPHMQGQSLARFFHESRKILVERGIIALDLNGVPEISIVKAGAIRSLNDLRHDRVIGPALQHVDILHMNEDELVLLTGCRILDTRDSEQEDEFNIAKAVDLFLQCGVAVVAVTRGRKGSYVACNNVERFGQSPALPSSWANCSVHMPASLLPPGTRINTNGAGDAFTSGLLVASMLRHTGGVSLERVDDPPPSRLQSPNKKNESKNASSTTKKMTPYTLYMRENYVSLKQQCGGDKKAIFSSCHEMWENESEDVKAMYARMVKEEYDDSATEAATAIMSDTSMDALESKHSREDAGVQFQTEEVYNASLKLESAVQLAGLIAARHVDASTRDLNHLDLTKLLQESIMTLSPTPTIEI
ncbi:myo-inositol-1-phosphate synthase [Nitzschia inconspicua]|uniref:inositol-3-phosphate synthase n=1 Tax=Nitzschia inconspicua TaxID=303405 RepID=A0A9K3L7N7_9STRA|nr:myo-inositol-1-phosphate synthase [Nitzschia inconspicua]